MANTISSIDTSIKSLAPTFQTAIKTIIESESGPLNRTQAQKDQIEVRRGVYTDIKTNFDALQTAIQALISTHASYGMKSVSKQAITPGTAGATVLTATSTESTAAAEFDLVVTTLAKAQSKSTSAAASSDVALGKSGTFWLGGNGTSSASVTPNDSVTNAVASTIASGQRELGAGSYTLQVRDSSGVRQFRLVDADGKAVSIRKNDGTGFSTDWQNMTSGSYDTGRGLNLTLNTLGATTSTALTYTAAGTSITINSTDTLRNIATAINAASQPDGRDFKASIVANKLVITGAQTGENHSMIFTDGAGLGFGADLQPAQNAQFTVNGMSVSRASNANITDLIDGVTLNLASDAEGKSARLSISASFDKAAGLMKTMVDKFNAAVTHLKDKLASTPKTGTDGKTIYTRGPLSGDLGFSSLRLDMINRLNRNITNSGSLKNLSEIGITFDKDMKLSIDSSKFSDALKNQTADVTALLDKAMGDLNTLVSRFAGSSGTIARTLTTIDDQRKSYDQRIARHNENLTIRKQTLYNQYLSFQTQIADYGRTAEWLGMFTGTTTNTSG
ncbi:MAG: flagellar filament capping protein FliD [Chloroflexi bacterium]|nr:flagellar filament capping protein FliD [Chloroflexota bacterium]